MSALQAAALTGDVVVRLGVAVLLLVLLVWLLLLAIRPARAAVAFIAPGAGPRLRALAAATRARHEAGCARLAALD
ncbi:hypothetical protein, partial [Pseudokineococcus marinus]|nr:hypothetical protein [Pseudokineococcus marinus]